MGKKKESWTASAEQIAFLGHRTGWRGKYDQWIHKSAGKVTWVPYLCLPEASPSSFLCTSGFWILYAYFSWHYHWLNFLGFYLNIPSFNLTMDLNKIFSGSPFLVIFQSEYPGTLYVSTITSGTWENHNNYRILRNFWSNWFSSVTKIKVP